MIYSSCSCSIRTTDITSLHALAAEDITSIEIEVDERNIYTLHSIHARLSSIEEYLNGDYVNITLHFNFS